MAASHAVMTEVKMLINSAQGDEDEILTLRRGQSITGLQNAVRKFHNDGGGEEETHPGDGEDINSRAPLLQPDSFLAEYENTFNRRYYKH